MVDRDLVAEERATRQATRPGGGRSGMDSGTRLLALIAGGIGALLVATVGGWSLLGHHPTGIPLIAPPPGPVRVKPTDPGGMQLMGTQVAQTNGPAAQALAPGPEAPAPQALQAEIEAARKADAPAPANTPTARTAATPADGSTSTAPTLSPPAPSPAAPAAVAPAPAAPADAVPGPGPGSSEATETAPAEASPPTPPSAVAGGHAVQLAALDSEQAAHAEWSRLAKQAPTLLGDRAPIIQHVSRGGRQFYRLRTGGFGSVADANAFCDRAEAAGIACTVADF